MKPEHRSLIQNADEFINKLSRPEQKEPPKELPSLPSFEFGKAFWPEPKEPLRKRLIAHVVYYYNIHKELPQQSELEKKFKGEVPASQDRSAWIDLLQGIAPSLSAQGIPAYAVPTEFLEPNFVLAVQFICNPLDKRSVQAKLKEAGLTTLQWKSLLRKESNHEYYKSCLNDIFNQDTKLSAKRALTELVESGDLQAIKYYNELVNEYRPHQQFNTDLSQILQIILTIVASYVDQGQLRKIAQEFAENALLSPQTPVIDIL